MRAIFCGHFENNCLSSAWLMVLSLEKAKEKRVFSLLLLTYSYLWALPEGAIARKSERKTSFFFAFCSLIRTFASKTINVIILKHET